MYIVSRLRWTTKGLERKVIAELTKRKEAMKFLENEQKADPKGCYVISIEKGAKNG